MYVLGTRDNVTLDLVQVALKPFRNWVTCVPTPLDRHMQGQMQMLLTYVNFAPCNSVMAWGFTSR